VEKHKFTFTEKAKTVAVTNKVMFTMFCKLKRLFKWISLLLTICELKVNLFRTNYHCMVKVKLSLCLT